MGFKEYAGRGDLGEGGAGEGGAPHHPGGAVHQQVRLDRGRFSLMFSLSVEFKRIKSCRVPPKGKDSKTLQKRG